MIKMTEMDRRKFLLATAAAGALSALGGIPAQAQAPKVLRIRSYSDLPISQDLTGAGDPGAVTCRVGDRQRTGSRTDGPIACAHNDFWAKLNARGCILSPNARVIIRSGTTKNLDPLACTNVPGRNGRLPPQFF